jgi:hypothetical protein
MQRIRVVKGTGNPGRTPDTGNKNKIVNVQLQFVNRPQNRLGNRTDAAARAGGGPLNMAAGVFLP